MKFLSPSSTMIMEHPSVRPKTFSRSRSKTVSGALTEKDSKRVHTITLDRRRGSVDSVFAGLNKPFLSCHRDKANDAGDKKRTEKSTPCSHSVSVKKDKEKHKRDLSVPTRDSKSSGCGLDLKPILKSCPRTNGVYLSVPIETSRSSASDSEKSSSSEGKFSYRLPLTTKMPVRKSVSFREESEDTDEDFRHQPRRFSSPSVGFGSDLTMSSGNRQICKNIL